MEKGKEKKEKDRRSHLSLASRCRRDSRAAAAPTREQVPSRSDSIAVSPVHDNKFSIPPDGGSMAAMWVFGYGSLISNPGFAYESRVVGFVRDYRRIFYQGSTDHRGTPQFPGRTVTLEHQPGATCWGAAYKISREEDRAVALEYLEVREKQYDEKIYLDLYTDPSPKIPAVENMMVYLATTNKESNEWPGKFTLLKAQLDLTKSICSNLRTP